MIAKTKFVKGAYRTAQNLSFLIALPSQRVIIYSSPKYEIVWKMTGYVETVSSTSHVKSPSRKRIEKIEKGSVTTSRHALTAAKDFIIAKQKESSPSSLFVLPLASRARKKAKQNFPVVT